MALHHIKLTVVGLQIHWRRYFARNRVSSLEDCSPGNAIEAQDSIQSKMVVDLMTELNKMTELIHNQNETIETLKHDMEETGRRQHEKLKERIEHLEKSQKRMYR